MKSKYWFPNGNHFRSGDHQLQEIHRRAAITDVKDPPFRWRSRAPANTVGRAPECQLFRPRRAPTHSPADSDARPTISSNLASESGSGLKVNVRMRCGFSLAATQHCVHRAGGQSEFMRRHTISNHRFARSRSLRCRNSSRGGTAVPPLSNERFPVSKEGARVLCSYSEIFWETP